MIPLVSETRGMTKRLSMSFRLARGWRGRALLIGVLQWSCCWSFVRPPRAWIPEACPVSASLSTHDTEEEGRRLAVYHRLKGIHAHKPLLYHRMNHFLQEWHVISGAPVPSHSSGRDIYKIHSQLVLHFAVPYETRIASEESLLIAYI